MEAILQALKNYLCETLGLQIKLNPWVGKKHLPFFLKDLYALYSASLLDQLCILVVALQSDGTAPGTIHKHLEQIEQKAKIPCVYVSKSSSSYDCKRLIELHVQFVIPGKQIYLPFLGIDWRKTYQKNRTLSKTMSPSTQAVIIYALMHPEEKQLIPLELAKILNYSPMTMTRALNELESFELGKTIRKGKERLFSFTKPPAQLWTQVKPLMQNPVKKRRWLRLDKSSLKKIQTLGALSGFNALSEQSTLALPTHPVYAISLQNWNTLLQQSGRIQELPYAEDADIELEIWNYDPALFAKKGMIDLFSLSLSLRENQDERVEMALEKLTRSIKWSKD